MSFLVLVARCIPSFLQNLYRTEKNLQDEGEKIAEMMARLFALWLCSLLFFSCVSGNKQYERYCDEMIQQAGVAASHHNSGMVAAAEAAVTQVRELFQKAITLQPDEPQAYLNMAVFLSNIHEYDDSITQFEKARVLLGSTIPRQVESQINMGVRRAKYGKYSMQRDKAYAEGKGNITEAYHWGLLQLTVSNELFRINHEVATLEVMLCEYNFTLCEQASKRFTTASLIAQGFYTQTRQPDVKKEAKMGCLHSKMVHGDFRRAIEVPPHLQVDVTEVEPDLFFNKVLEEIIAHGHDGVMTFTEEKHCHVVTSSSDTYTDIGRSVLVQRTGPSNTVALSGKVLSLLQFSGAAFYHWFCEAIPRLAIAESLLGTELSAYKVLVPSIRGSPPSFVISTLQTFFPEISASNIVPHNVETQLVDGVEMVSWARQPCPPDSPFGNGSTPLQCASLAHPTALRAARDRFVSHLTPSNTQRAPYVLIAGRGHDTTMRNFDEQRLFAAVRTALPSSVEVFLFDASQQSLPESLALFHGAVGVVGVHGGALSNIMVCRPSTFLVEIGMNTIGAQQYRHVSTALGMRYYFSSVYPDSLKRSIAAPFVDFDDKLVSTLVAKAYGLDNGEDEL